MCVCISSILDIWMDGWMVEYMMLMYMYVTYVCMCTFAVILYVV